MYTLAIIFARDTFKRSQTTIRLEPAVHYGVYDFDIEVAEFRSREKRYRKRQQYDAKSNASLGSSDAPPKILFQA